VACSPSWGLLLRHAEHSAGRAGAPELPDARLDELVPEADPPGPHQEDVHPPVPCGWDAWDGARPDAEDAADLHREPADAGAEKLAVPARDGQARDAWSRQGPPPAQLARPAWAAELCTPDAVQSAAQSCAALEKAG